MTKEQGNSNTICFTELNTLNKELMRSLDALGKSANIIRRLFIRGLTKERLSKIDKVLDTVNSMIKKIIVFHPGVSSQSELISANNSNGSWQWVDGQSELISGNTSNSNWQSRVSTISINTVNSINNKKQKKIPKYFKDYIYEFVNDQRFNDLYKFDKCNEIDYCLEECIDVLHDAVLYFAISSRNNNQEVLLEDRENVLKIVNIINSLFYHNLSIAEKIDHTFNEQGSNVQNDFEQIKDWLQNTLSLENLLDEEDQLRKEMVLLEFNEKEQINRAKIIEDENTLHFSLLQILQQESAAIYYILEQKKFLIKCINNIINQEIGFREYLINFELILKEELIRENIIRERSIKLCKLFNNFNDINILMQQNSIQRIDIQQARTENWNNILTKFNDEKILIYTKELQKKNIESNKSISTNKSINALRGFD